MKIAIASTGNDLHSVISSIFSRCPYFVFYDTDNGSLEYFPNPYGDQEAEAGQSVVQLLGSRNVVMVISGRFGLKVKQWLDSRKIQMVVYKNPITIGEILQLFYNKSQNPSHKQPLLQRKEFYRT